MWVWLIKFSFLYLRNFLYHEYLHVHLVFGQFGTCIGRAVFGSEQELSFANILSWFVDFSGRNVANDFDTTIVCRHRVHWWWLAIWTDFLECAQRWQYVFVWCDLSNIWEEQLEQRIIWQCVDQIESVPTIVHQKERVWWLMTTQIPIKRIVDNCYFSFFFQSIAFPNHPRVYVHEYGSVRYCDHSARNRAARPNIRPRYQQFIETSIEQNT